VETTVETGFKMLTKVPLTCMFIIHTQCVETCLKSGLRVPCFFAILCTNDLTSRLNARRRRAFSARRLRGIQLLASNNLKGDRRNDVVTETNRSFVLTSNLDGASDLDFALVDVAKSSSNDSFCHVRRLN